MLAFSGFTLISQLWLFYLLVIIFGLGYGSGLTQESPSVANIFGLSSHGLLLGVASSGHTMGEAAGTLLGGYLYDMAGSYQLTFVICGISSVIDLALVLGLTPVRHSMERAKRAASNKGHQGDRVVVASISCPGIAGASTEEGDRNNKICWHIYTLFFLRTVAA